MGFSMFLMCQKAAPENAPGVPVVARPVEPLPGLLFPIPAFQPLGSPHLKY